jgi:hypothetical protein
MEQIKNPKGHGTDQRDHKDHEPQETLIQCHRTVFAFERIAHAEEIFWTGLTRFTGLGKAGNQTGET